MNKRTEAMEAAAVTPASEYMRNPTAARLELMALVHLEALIQRGMTARQAMEAARDATTAAIAAAYAEITGEAR